MQDYGRQSSVVLVGACALWGAAPSPAQQPAGDGSAIDEIQVTASRRPLAATRVAAALTVVREADLSGEKLTTEALASEVGVYLQQTTVGQGAAIIRGLKGSEILHLVDGLRLNNAIFRNAPTQYLALVAPGSIERIEVVRGSPTSLYGSDAVGGVIQVISRLPRFEETATQMRRQLVLGADSAELTRTLRGSLDIGHRRLGGLLSLAYQDSGNRRTGSGERVAPSGFRAFSARTALLARPADDRSWLADLQFLRQPATPRVDELVPGFGQSEASSEEFFFAPNERHFVHLRHRRGDGLWSADWAVDLGWQRIVDDRRTRNADSALRRLEKNRSDLFGLAVNAARDVGSASWVYGAELYHDTVRSSRVEVDLATADRTVRQARFPDGAEVRQGAVFAHLSQVFGERHTLSGGLRVSGVNIELPATAASPAAEITIEDFSADAGWIFELGDGLQLIANVGRGFRAPNVFDLGTLGERPGNRFNVPNPGLESERVLQYDLGLRRQTANWSAELVAYRLDYRDRIQSALTGDTTADGRDVVQSRNLGRARIHGIEAGLRWHPEAALSAELLANRTHGAQRESDGALVAGDRIPPLNGRLTLRWQALDRLGIESSLVFADGQDRLSPRDVRDVRIDPAGTPGWARVDLGLSWQASGVWTLDAGIENLLERRYRVHGSGIDAPGFNLYLFARALW